MARKEIRLGTGAKDFIWASGVEDTFVPQVKQGHRALDEYELLGHYEHWRADLALAQEVGLNALRWGVPWYRVEPQQGQFDWSWTDQVIPYMVQELGITPIIDLMHYGCPFWLTNEFTSPEYPRAVAAYAAAFAERYRGLVRWYTPLNEPLINSIWCGLLGVWPPYLRGDAGFVRIMLQLCRGILLTVAALREVQPDAVMVHVDAAGMRRLADPDLQPHFVEHQHRNWVSYDLITGRVTPEHPLYAWLLRNGATSEELADMARQPISLDVLGLNFYPQWSTRQMYLNARGNLAFRIIERDGVGFAEMIRMYYERYRAPVIITETSAFGRHQGRSRWLASSLAAIKLLRTQGIPVHGYTWFPMFTMYKWDYRRGRLPLDKYRIELGLYKLNAEPNAERWQPTPLIEEMRRCIQDPQAAVGELYPERAQSGTAASQEAFPDEVGFGT